MEVFLSLGSNVGCVTKHLRRAVAHLEHDPRITVLRASSYYLTEPVGVREGNWFANQMIVIDTTYTPLQLLRATQRIERTMGRTRKKDNSPRIIDIDIISFEHLVFYHDNLMIPHPRAHERLFVLVPLKEIAPRWKHPSTEISVTMLIQQCKKKFPNQKIQKLDVA